MFRNLRSFAVALLALLPACAPHYPDDRFVQLVRAVRPSVVLLTMRVPPEKKGDTWDDGFATGSVVASGAWGSDILTVAHAVTGARDMHVTIQNKRKTPARVLALDPDLDIALVRADAQNLPVLALGRSSQLGGDLGREIGLVGYPVPDEFDDEGLGLDTSLVTGRLSALRKHALEVMLAIVPGESGAPIFLIDTGEIVGMAESRFDDEHSIGFALPVDDARAFLHAHDAEHGF